MSRGSDSDDSSSRRDGHANRRAVAVVPGRLSNLYAAQRASADYETVRTLLATVAVVLAVSGAVLYASEAQRSVSERNFQEAQIAKETAVAMLARNGGCCIKPVGGSIRWV